VVGSIGISNPRRWRWIVGQEIPEWAKLVMFELEIECIFWIGNHTQILDRVTWLSALTSIWVDSFTVEENEAYDEETTLFDK